MSLLRQLRPPIADLVIGGLLFAFTVLEEYAGSSSVDSHHLGQTLVAAAVTLPVLWRRGWPMATFLVSATAFGAKALLFHPMSAPLGEPLAFAVVIYTVSARLRLRPSLLLLLYAGVFGYLRSLGSPGDGVGGNIVNELFLLLPWGIGRLVNALESKATVSEQRVAVVEAWAAESSREAVADERLRIARELHDIVAHNIGVILLHAGGGRRMLDHDPEQSRTAFATIEQAAGDALAETRRLLDVLRTDHDQLTRQPTVDDLPELVRRVREAGVGVDLELERVEPVSPGLGLCVYRIVQEACTNAVRHGRARRIGVRLRDVGPDLELDVTDDGGPVTSDSAGSGHGIAGMRERVALFGGTLSIGPRAEGGFAVHATFPRERV